MTINSKKIPNKHKLRKEEKMARTKNRIKKMTFQTQDRKYEPLSDNDKYIIKMAGYQKEIIGKQDEGLQRTTRGVASPSYI